MLRFRRPGPKKTVGLPPGTLVYTGDKRIDEVRITIMDYDETSIQEKEIKTLQESLPFRDKSTVTWINIDGLHQVELIEEAGEYFKLHPLVLEDIVNTDQRPRIEDFEDYIFVVVKMLDYDERKGEITFEQFSLILKENLVISFQEKPGDVLAQLRERIRNGKGRIRKVGADYLAYALLDGIVDNYFVVLEKLGGQIEDVEEELLSRPSSETLQTIHILRREIAFFRKSVWPLRELVGHLGRVESPLIHESTDTYLRDAYDHVIQVIDTLETFRDMLSGMLEVYLSTISNRMNEVMKVLTIIATIFIPLGFIAGVYGMNFEFMPELRWYWGYPMVLGAMAGVAIGMLAYFFRKKWL